MKNDNNLPLEKEDGFLSSVKSLRKYDNTEFPNEFYKATNIKVSNDFEGQRIKNGEYNNCIFLKNNFTYAGAAEAKFFRCRMLDCIIKGTNMQFCDFSKSLFYSPNTISILDSNLNQSCFFRTMFYNARIENCSVSQSQFINTKIKKTDFRHSTLQDNLFSNTFISDSSFTGCNMEYSEFINVKLKNTILPFHQIPYIYGGFACIKNPENSVKITSSMENAPILNPSEYLALLPDFLNYYLRVKEYFPLVNIYLEQKKHDLAMEYIKEGLSHYILQKDFRKLKALCRLATQNDVYTRHQLNDLYFKIVHYFMTIPLSQNEKHQFDLHIDEIKKILVDNRKEKSHLLLVAKSNLSRYNSNEIGMLYSVIEDCLQYANVPDENYGIEIRHNSEPLSFWIDVCCLDPNCLILFAGLINMIFTGNEALLTQAISVCANIATIAAFIDTLVNKKQIEKAVNNGLSQNSAPKTYALKKHELLKSQNIKVSLSIGNIHFNYQKKEHYK